MIRLIARYLKIVMSLQDLKLDFEPTIEDRIRFDLFDRPTV